MPIARALSSGGLIALRCITDKANVTGNFRYKRYFLNRCFVRTGAGRQIADLRKNSLLGFCQFFPIRLSGSIFTVLLYYAEARRIWVGNHLTVWASAGGVEVAIAASAVTFFDLCDLFSALRLYSRYHCFCLSI